MNSFNLKNLATARAGNVIGGGDWSRHRILPDIMRAYKNNQTVTIRHPYASRPWQFVLDCLSGYLTLGSALYSDSKFSGSWNIGPVEHKNYYVIDVVNILKDKIKINLNIENLNSKKECYSLRLDVSKAINELDWKPKLNFETTIDYALSGYLDEFNDKDILEARINQIKRYCGI
jgi:CDP-glucose 4,6-dehydratase